ncbi:MAG: DUF120 domain-containing protein [Candidatus Heimdallarchaeota archaeon]|nr:DUF120 domain-containing protein [Candidatus Heimdallarchaeota archaeon]
MGDIVTGFGRGARFVSLPVYESIFEKHLGKTPFHGTLNLVLSEEDGEKINDKFKSGVIYDNLVNDGKETGGVLIIDVKIQCKPNNSFINAVAVRPLLTRHDSSVAEIVAHENIRELWDLEDGCKLQITL